MGAVKGNTSGASKSSREVSSDLESYGGHVSHHSGPRAATDTMCHAFLGCQEAAEIASETFPSQPL